VVALVPAAHPDDALPAARLGERAEGHVGADEPVLLGIHGVVVVGRTALPPGAPGGPAGRAGVPGRAGSGRRDYPRSVDRTSVRLVSRQHIDLCRVGSSSCPGSSRPRLRP